MRRTIKESTLRSLIRKELKKQLNEQKYVSKYQDILEQMDEQELTWWYRIIDEPRSRVKGRKDSANIFAILDNEVRACNELYKRKFKNK